MYTYSDKEISDTPLYDFMFKEGRALKDDEILTLPFWQREKARKEKNEIFLNNLHILGIKGFKQFKQSIPHVLQYCDIAKYIWKAEDILRHM